MKHLKLIFSVIAFLFLYKMAYSQNPCESIISIDGVGAGYTQTYTGGGTGIWDGSACYYAPGIEQIYSFVAPATDTYAIEVTSASGYVNYAWKTASCGETGWTCISYLGSTGTIGPMEWTAGTTYYILLDDEDNTTGTHQFYINNDLTPELSYSGSSILDYIGGNGNNVPEPGESVGIEIWLVNLGMVDANNVTAILSTTDSDITITDNEATWSSIMSGYSSWGTDIYGFNVSAECTEKDVTFSLDITSDEGSWTDEFTVHIYVDPEPDLNLNSFEVTDNTINGDNDGLAEPGESAKVSISLYNWGYGIANNVSAVLSTTDTDITITESEVTWLSIAAMDEGESLDSFNFDVSPGCQEKDVTFSLDITSDEGSWTDEFTVHIYDGTTVTPCDNIISIEGAVADTQTYSNTGSGIWSTSFCFYDTPGIEQIYSYVAPYTGIYSIEVTSAGSWVDYAWQASDCGKTGWICISDINSTGTYGSMEWTEGTTYYILLDSEGTFLTTHEFFINAPPNIEYVDHTVVDNTGNNNSLAEPEEVVKMPIYLENSGGTEANNVSAVLTTVDTDITITSDEVTWALISSESGSESLDSFNFEVLPGCPEKDVTFSLDITSDEGSWTNELTVHIYVDPTPELDYLNHTIDDNTSNNNGLAEPGESIAIPIWLGNIGPLAANNVSAVLSTIDSDITITDDEVTWASILAGGSDKSLDSFNIDVSSECPEKDVTFTVDITSDEGSWEYEFTMHIYIDPLPELACIDYVVYDGSSNNNGLADAGESIDVPIWLENIGPLAANNVSAILSTTDSNITITDSVVTWSFIVAGESVVSLDSFNFDVSPVCEDKDVTFSLKIASDEGSWTDEFTVHIYNDSFIVAAIVVPVSGGSVSGAGKYGSEQTASLTANPASGYVFENWTKNGVEVSSDLNYTFTVTQNVSLSANFSEQNTSISEISRDINLNIYPNPTDGEVYLKFKTENVQEVNISVYDSYGKLLYKQKIQKFVANELVEIDLSMYNSGVYYLQINNTEFIRIEKIIKE